MKKFGIDNPFFAFMGRVGDILILNILFVITSIPVVTIGMSLSAMYRVTLRMARKECNYVAKEYFRACREEWKKSTVIWLIMLMSGGVLVFDVTVGKDMWNALNAAVGALIFIWGMLFTYVFAVQARFENTVKNIFKNALYMAVRHFPFTVIMMVLNAIPAVCILFGSMTMALATPIYVAAGFTVTARINSIFLNRIFRKYAPEEEEAEDANRATA
ncbi:YesL family protein [Mediterraneibacter glycyrrhizinilyticus]|uniref:YesL family protein n=1 Tax=Mediterraneibacter glycyrrhizinilyticus TaxID=342942 RepID=UPI002657F3D7|nr:YesL family protein [Mediterraneibacter glycyrrhizinilyticus]MCF2570095.1 YesL family protein [Mediterraneibacter glycyrrhizinilyticus]